MNIEDIKNSLKWNAFLLPGITVVSLFTNIFLVRTLSLEAYALYMIMISFKNTFTGISDFGVSTSYTRFFHHIEHESGRQNAVRFTYQVMGIKIALTTVLLMVVFALKDMSIKYFKLEALSLDVLILVMALIIFEGISNVLERFFEVNLKQKVLNIVKLANTLAFVIALLSLYFLHGLSIKTVLYALLSSTILKMALMWRIFLRDVADIPVSDAKSWIHSNRLRFFKSSATIYFDKISSTVMTVSFIILIITPYFDKKDIAYLALAGDFVSKAISLFLFPTSGLILPVFSHYYTYQKDHGLDRAYEYSLKYLGLIFTIAAGLLVVNATDIVTILYSKRYLISVPYISILLPVIFFEQAILSNATSTFFVKEAYFVYWVNRLIVIGGIVALSAIIMHLKVNLFNIVLLFCLLKCLNVIMLAYTNQKMNKTRFPLKFYIKTIFIVVIAGMVSSIAISNIRKGEVIDILVALVTYSISIILGIRFFALFDASDKNMFLRLEIPFFRRFKWILG
ncbi:MAG: oligosaccharide flippase family protein [Nitrospirae bacterium]|nr:oligosaccharide flippase family protein [Nitrospirota bacterium]